MKNNKQNRREFLQIGAAGLTALTFMKKTNAETQTNIQIEEITINELQDAMKSGKTSAVEITRKYLERIREIDPKLNSVLETNPDALKIAEEMDKERKNGKIRSQMHGIPVLIKDNIDTADKMKTTAGSLALIDAPTPKNDAFIVSQMRKAGAIIIGKTNLSEWANFRS
ncbi:MAG: amidase family protein, partial [Acidobacteriota bacterium]